MYRPGLYDLPALLTRRVEAHPDRPALTFGGQRVTYAELLSEIHRAINALCELGIGPASKVALMLPNGPEFVACWLGLAWLGATLVPINTKLKGDLLRYQLGHADLDAAVIGAGQFEEFEVARPERGSERLVLAGPDEDAPPGWLTLNGLLRTAPTTPPPAVAQSGDALALGMYTSGTTGRPKGIMIGRQAQLKHGLNYTGLLGIGERETAYVYLPLFHVTAMGSTLGSLLGGAHVALDDGFSAFGFWDRCRRHDAVVFTFVGSVLTMLHRRPPGPGDSDNPVRRVVGAATPAWLWHDFERRFGVEIVETYGQTEMVALWLMPPESPHLPAPSPELGRGGGEVRAKLGTVGKPPDNRFEAKIVDPDGRELPPGQRGEIAIRPADPLDMMLGYFRDPQATAAAIRDGGWYYTGDLGVADEEGYFAYAGRLKDCIRRRGEMIAAYEIERVVNAHPGVLESAAVGVPSELGEEDVKLCVVPRPEAELRPRDVWDYCRAELPAFMVPRWIQLRGSLPKTATERIRKPDLAAEGSAGCWTAGAACAVNEE